MKKVLSIMLILASFSSFGGSCADADYSCPKNGLMTEAQSLGRVCVALNNSLIPVESTEALMNLSQKKHRLFLSELKVSVNSCMKYNKHGEPAAYMDVSLTKNIYRGLSPYFISIILKQEQRQVFL